MCVFLQSPSCYWNSYHVYYGDAGCWNEREGLHCAAYLHGSTMVGALAAIPDSLQNGSKAMWTLDQMLKLFLESSAWIGEGLALNSAQGGNKQP